MQTRNSAPSSDVCTLALPPCASAMPFTMVRPIPQPFVQLILAELSLSNWLSEVGLTSGHVTRIRSVRPFGHGKQDQRRSENTSQHEVSVKWWRFNQTEQKYIKARA